MLAPHLASIFYSINNNPEFKANLKETRSIRADYMRGMVSDFSPISLPAEDINLIAYQLLLINKDEFVYKMSTAMLSHLSTLKQEINMAFKEETVLPISYQQSEVSFHTFLADVDLTSKSDDQLISSIMQLLSKRSSIKTLPKSKSRTFYLTNIKNDIKIIQGVLDGRIEC